eukprot:c14526_g1_i1.p2 GENE.c14526_g1_i1~~c14526_g1_i1.p2  ORF type:complete len:213 (-),score=37.58 c14526_g1_i1:226-819(-)
MSSGMELDALPYIDLEYNNPATKALVARMIEEEAAQGGPAPKKTPFAATNPYDSKRTPAMFAEHARVAMGKPMAPFDDSRYSVPVPADSAPQSEWEAAAANAAAQLGHQSARLMNLELLRQFGQQKWRLSTQQLEALRDAVKAELEDVANRTTAVNRERKLAQEKVQQTLARLEAEWQSLIVSNAHLERVCAQLEGQ